MKTISVFKEESNRKTFEELRERLDRYRSFKFFRFFLSLWALIYITIQILVIVADMLWHFSTRLFPDMTISNAVTIGLTLGLWTAGITGLLALVYAVITRLRLQERDRNDLSYLKTAYKNGQLDALHRLLSERSTHVNGFKVVAEGLDDTEISLIQKAARGSYVFLGFEYEFKEVWRILMKATEILQVRQFNPPETA